MSDFCHSISFLSSERVKFDSHVYVIKIFFNLNSLGNKKFELFSQGIYDCQNFETENLFITDHEDVKKSAFD